MRLNLRNGRFLSAFFLAAWVLGAASNQPNVVDGKKVEFYGSMVSLRYKYVLASDRETKKTIKIPIFKGEEGEITEAVLTEYMERTLKERFANAALAALVIKTEPGQLKKELIQMIDFYGQHLFADIDRYKPSKIGCDGPACWFIWYDFKYEGVDCSMMITVSGQGNVPTKWPTDIRDLPLHQRASKIYVEFLIGQRSPFFVEKK